MSKHIKSEYFSKFVKINILHRYDDALLQQRLKALKNVLASQRAQGKITKAQADEKIRELIDAEKPRVAPPQPRREPPRPNKVPASKQHVSMRGQPVVNRKRPSGMAPHQVV
jgi:hypothetical protein